MRKAAAQRAEKTPAKGGAKAAARAPTAEPALARHGAGWTSFALGAAGASGVGRDLARADDPTERAASAFATALTARHGAAAGRQPTAPASGTGGRPADLDAPTRAGSPADAVGRAVRSPGAGARLQPAVRGRIEGLLGISLERVRVHTDADAQRAARRIGARAFTFGEHVFLARGERADDLALMAHEAVHVAQQRELPALARWIAALRDPAGIVAPAGSADLDDLAAAFADPNLVLHERALEALSTRSEPEAAELIASRVADRWMRRQALDAALINFLLHPETALAVIGRLMLEALDGSTPEELLLYFNAMRASARGPAPDQAYRMLDAWIEEQDVLYGGLVSRRMRVQAIGAMLERQQQRWRDSTWFDDLVVPMPAVRRFVERLAEVQEGLPLLDDEAVRRLHADTVRVEIDADRAYERMAELRGQLSELIVQGIPLESDEARFLREHQLALYEAVLDAAPSAAGMDALLAQAEAAHADQAALYQQFKVDVLRQLWQEVNTAPYFMTRYDASGMRAQSIALFDRFYAHRDDLQPRFEDMLARHDGGEALASEELATIQRDLYILAIEGFANQHFSRAHQAWEHLQNIEGDVWGDFDDLQQRIRGYADAIHAGVMADQLQRVVEVTQDFDYRFLFDFEVNHEIETKRDQTLIIDLGILAVSMLAGGLVGLAVRGGGLLLFGARMGATGVRLLSTASFLGNVAGFTLAHEGLSSAAFGHAFRSEDLPLQFLENAAVFRIFGIANGFTAAIGRGAEGALARTLAFGTRHGINIAIFGAGTAGLQLLKTGQLPQDWREFMVHTLATYVVIGVVGAGMHRVQAAIEPRLVTRAMTERFARIDAMEASLREGFGALEGAEPGVGERTLEAPALEALRAQARAYARETVSLMEFLGALGHVPAAEVENVRASSANLVERMDALELVSQRATVIELRTLPELTAMGDGVSYLIRSRAPGGRLGDALTRYTEAGFEVETDARTGEIRVSSELGLVARFIPGLAAESLGAVLAGRGLPSEAIAPLAELPPAYHEVLLTLHPQVLLALAQNARAAPERLPQLVDSLVAIDAVTGVLRGDPARAVQYVRFAGVFEGLLGAELHVHSVGAVPGSHNATAARLVTRLLGAETPEQVAQRFDSARELIELLPEAAVGARRDSLLGDLAALRAVAEDAAVNRRSETAPPEAARFEAALAEVLRLPLESGAEGPQVEAFFRLYSEVGAAVWPAGPTARAGVLGRIAEGMRSAGVAYVELRHGSSEKLETTLRRAGAIDAEGRPVADARVILTLSRSVLSADPVQAQQAIADALASVARARADPVLARIIVGVDLSGVETTGDAAMPHFTGLARELVRGNFESYERRLNDPALADPDGRSLAERVNDLLDGRSLLPAGESVIAYGRRLMAELPGETTPEPRPQQAELALLNRAIGDALLEIGAERGELLVPPDIMGITMHAGEQLAGRASLRQLLDLCGESLAAGTDRLGHGLVLGIPFPAGLGRLGFESFSSPMGRVWARRVSAGAETEWYSEADVAHMEQLRVEIINEAAALGVTVEVNPTSNLTLSGLSGAHPVAEMLDVNPALRIAVSTDNPAIHRISLGSELALLSISLGGDFPLMVRVFLEGYASRLGRRPISDTAARATPPLAEIRANIVDGLVEHTPPEQRAEVLLELNERHRLYDESALPQDVSLDDAGFRELLTPFVERTVY